MSSEGDRHSTHEAGRVTKGRSPLPPRACRVIGGRSPLPPRACPITRPALSQKLRTLPHQPTIVLSKLPEDHATRQTDRLIKLTVNYINT
jgi:hypothetical protein